jgi:hypothetical protein
VYGLEEEFGDEIDFIWLNIDDSSTRAMREEFGIVQRTRYVLVDENNNEVMRWFGPLYEVGMEFEIADWLEARA